MPKTVKRRDDIPANKRHKAFSLAEGSIIWLVVWVISFFAVFLLRSAASNLFFRFMCILPIFTLIYAFIGRFALRAYVTAGSVTVEKTKPAKYEFRMYNATIFPFPFVDAYLKLPQENAVRCSDRLVKLNVTPSADYPVENEIVFRFRGTYEIGVSCFYVYDFFRMFRVRVPADCYQTVYVLPRRLMMTADGIRKTSDSADQTRKDINSYEKIEVSDIRDYRPGDPIKSIHWKLSSKSENTMVREFNTGSTNLTYIFADMSARFPDHAPDRSFDYLIKSRDYKNGKTTDFTPDTDELVNDEAYEDMNEYCADGVVELSIAAVIKELNAGRRVCLEWFDTRSDIGAYSYEIESLSAFDAVFPIFATAPLVPKQKTVAELSKMVSNAEDAKYIFILPAIDSETIASLGSRRSVSSSSNAEENEVIVYTADERYAHPALRAGFIEECTAMLAASGLTLTKGSLDGFTDVNNKAPGKEDSANE